MHAADRATPLSFLPLEGGGRCARDLDGDCKLRITLARRLSRWTHRVGVALLHKTPPPDAPHELAPRVAIRDIRKSKKTALTRGASSSPLEGEAKVRRRS